MLGAPWARSPFVGRQRELALLHNRLEAVRAGEGQVISLVGPPGWARRGCSRNLRAVYSQTR